MYLQREKKHNTDDFAFPNLFAIKYVDFSVYILACVPYLVGKQNSKLSSQGATLEKKDLRAL